MDTTTAPYQLDLFPEVTTSATSTFVSTTAVNGALVGDQTSTPLTAAAISDSAAGPEILPKRPRTAAQAEASRLNGAKSKGPKTDAGKAASRLNATRHGLLAEKLRPLAGWRNDDRDYDHQLEGLQSQYQPQSVIEHNLVELLAHDYLMLAKNKAWQARIMTPADPNESPWMVRHPVDLAQKQTLAEMILEDLDADANLVYLPDHAQQAAWVVTEGAQSLIEHESPSSEQEELAKAIAQAKVNGFDTTSDDAMANVLTRAAVLSVVHRQLLAGILKHSLFLIESAERFNEYELERQTDRPTRWRKNWAPASKTSTNPKPA